VKVQVNRNTQRIDLIEIRLSNIEIKMKRIEQLIWYVAAVVTVFTGQNIVGVIG
jgi:hypothetical protein